ncbi:MAG: hypothetical protein ABIQ95_12345 [Bdellovibrionia bacterium]
MIQLFSKVRTSPFIQKSKYVYLILASMSLMGQAGCPTITKCPDGASCLPASKILATGMTVVEGCDFGTGGLAGDQWTVGLSEGVVGYDHFIQGQRPGDPGNCDKVFYFYRTGVLFNDTVLKNFVTEYGLLKATFRFLVPKSSVSRRPGDIPRPSQYAFSCVARVSAAKSSWVDADSNVPIPYDRSLAIPIPYRQSAPFSNKVVTIRADLKVKGVVTEVDILPIVQRWVLGRDLNVGLVLSGNNETYAPDQEVCESWTQLHQLVLVPARTHGLNGQKAPKELVLDGQLQTLEAPHL